MRAIIQKINSADWKIKKEAAEEIVPFMEEYGNRGKDWIRNSMEFKTFIEGLVFEVLPHSHYREAIYY